MATYKIVKNNLNAHVEMTVTAFRFVRNVQLANQYGKYWATELEWDTNQPDALERLLTGNEAIISFERIS